MVKDLTVGNPMKLMIYFALPLIIGNLFQQFYNIVDSIIVGQFVGKEALASVSSSFTIMVFLTSIIIGLCMGAGVVFSQLFGADAICDLKSTIVMAGLFIMSITVVLEVGALLGLDWIIKFMNIPSELVSDTRSYLSIIFCGLFFVFLYNLVASLLRALGDSKTPLYFLILSAVLNVVLDLFFVLVLDQGVQGVAIATLIAQGVAAVLCIVYSFKKVNIIHIKLSEVTFNQNLFKRTAQYALLTSVQQAIMNFGILMVQGLVNSFGTAAMAAFGAATKIDAFAYMPVQDFGNAFATYVAQNEGAGKRERIHEGVRCVVKMICVFCIIISIAVTVFAGNLMTIFIKPEEVEVIAIGVGYLRVVAPFYMLIGFLFMYYGYYRGIGAAKMSIVLTIVSLGTRVILAYGLAALPSVGLQGVWWAIPIGWAFADGVGYWIYRRKC